MDGWVKISRQITDNPLWLSEPFSKSQAWIDLIILARYEPGEIIIKGQIINLKRGQLAYSEKTLSERWNWSRHKVDNFLKYLEKGHQIEHQKTSITTLISILNYDKFQDKDTEQDIRRTSEGHQKDMNKERKEYKERKEERWSAPAQNFENPLFVKPTLDQVVHFFIEEKSTKQEATNFFNHYESNGWMVGQNKMSSMPAAARKWINNPKFPTNTNQSDSQEYKPAKNAVRM